MTCSAAAPGQPYPAEEDNLPLEAETDDQFDDSDSAFGGDVASTTTSISSSIMRYREENGRTYHAYKDGKYVLPNDEGENDRLDLQHHLFTLTFGGRLYLAPLHEKNLHRVLDVGTGTGLWAIDFADEHPQSQVLGNDLSPIQPVFLPPNLSFEVDDLEEPWTFSTKFDYIHARMMTGSIVDWPRLIKQSYENLTPGGWLELQDITFPAKCDDGTWPEDSSLKKWTEMMQEASLKFGRDASSAEQYKEQMIAAGFEDVVEIKYKWPMNRWPKDAKMKELGMWTCENFGGGLHGLSVALFTRALRWSTEELEVFLAGVRKEIKDTKIHSYFPIYAVYGRKTGGKAR